MEAAGLAGHARADRQAPCGGLGGDVKAETGQRSGCHGICAASPERSCGLRDRPPCLP